MKKEQPKPGIEPLIFFLTKGKKKEKGEKEKVTGHCNHTTSLHLDEPCLKHLTIDFHAFLVWEI